jgi:chromosome segregation ATPase
LRAAYEEGGLDDGRIRLLVAPFVSEYVTKAGDQNDSLTIFLSELNLLGSGDKFTATKNVVIKAVQFIAEIRNRLSAIKEDIQTLKRVKTDLVASIASRKVDIDVLKKDARALEKRIKRIDNELGKLEEERFCFQNSVWHWRSERDVARDGLWTLRRQLSGLRAEERRAYQRFWDRKKSECSADSISEDEREVLEEALRTAGEEYISSVFPRAEEVREDVWLACSQIEFTHTCLV